MHVKCKCFIVLELFLKLLKIRVLVGNFVPTFDIFKCLKSVQVASEPPILVRWKGGILPCSKDGYKNGKHFEDISNGAFEKFHKEFSFI